MDYAGSMLTFENRQIVVEETLVNGKVETPKTHSSYRVIQISEPVYQALLHQREETGQYEFVFCNEAGNPLDHRNVTKRVWNPTLTMLGLKRRRPYQTRHTTATLWLAAGENPDPDPLLFLFPAQQLRQSEIRPLKRNYFVFR